MSNIQAPAKGAARPVPCMNCIKAQVQDVDEDSHTQVCNDQITSGNKASACFQCWEKKTKCLPVDVQDQYVKAWLDLGPAADPMERWETAYHLKRHLGAAAISRVQQSHFDLITKTNQQVKATVDLLEGLFEPSMGDLAAYRDHLPSSHPLSAQYNSQYEDELLQDVKNSKNLDDMLAAASDLTCKAVEETGTIFNNLMAALLKRERERETRQLRDKVRFIHRKTTSRSPEVFHMNRQNRSDQIDRKVVNTK